MCIEGTQKIISEPEDIWRTEILFYQFQWENKIRMTQTILYDDDFLLA